MTHSADIAVLMPRITDFERHAIRYGGLVNALADLSLSTSFASTHDSFDATTGQFEGAYDINNVGLGSMRPTVVRDLTMPQGDRPLYHSDLKIVHDPGFSQYIANKSNLLKDLPLIHPVSLIADAGDIAASLRDIPGKLAVVKPLIGRESRGVTVGSKGELALASYPDQQYLVQEYIDTSQGIPSLNVGGLHNIRAISIGGQLIGAISRIGGTDPRMLQQDSYGYFIDVDALPQSMHDIVDSVHATLAGKPGDGQNVIAIDMMRGTGGDGERRDVLCEVNRRPVRIGPYSLRDTSNLDQKGLIELGGRWDLAEAALLATAHAA